MVWIDLGFKLKAKLVFCFCLGKGFGEDVVNGLNRGGNPGHFFLALPNLLCPGGQGVCVVDVTFGAFEESLGDILFLAFDVIGLAVEKLDGFNGFFFLWCHNVVVVTDVSYHIPGDM